MLLPKGKQKNVCEEYILYEDIPAPVHTGDTIGMVRYHLEDTILAEVPITAAENVAEIGFLELLFRMFGIYLMK